MLYGRVFTHDSEGPERVAAEARKQAYILHSAYILVKFHHQTCPASDKGMRTLMSRSTCGHAFRKGFVALLV